ncbi:hypothetical protein Mal35_51960 [Gimesia maris]|nr:hypothetical protein Mal35_51960 [Gimesia maris]
MCLRMLKVPVIGIVMMSIWGCAKSQTSKSVTPPKSVSSATTEKQSVTFEAALIIARLAIAEGKKKGVDHLAVTVVDEAGIPLVVLRTDLGTEQFITGATRKAWTAVNFKASTSDVLKTIKSDDGDDGQLPHAQKALFLMGGVPLKVGNVVVGGVGVAGSVEGPDDDSLAQLAAQAFGTMLGKQKSNVKP